MAHQPIPDGVFISCVSDEFEKDGASFPGLRGQLRAYLARTRIKVRVQEDFPQTAADTILKLADEIRPRARVIHLIGALSGSTANADAVAEYIKAEPTFLAHLPKLRDALGDFSGISYTQWEAFIALHHGISLLVYATDKASAQQTHLDRLKLARRYATPIKNDTDLLGQLIGDLHDILPNLDEQSQAQILRIPLNKESPYVGLRHFKESERDYFKGRDRLIEDLIQSSQAHPLLLVLGSSGSGKSSVIRAGVIPSLSRKSGAKPKVVVFNPDVDAFEGLYAGLLQAEFSQEAARMARTVSADIFRECFAKLRKPGELWLFVIDQFEEIFTRTPKTEEAKARVRTFVAALVAVAKSADPDLRVILAMRDDFFSNLEGYTELSGITDKSFVRVTGMTNLELRDVISQPAAAHGVVFEAGLIEAILRDVEDQKGRLPLPLLQYTLETLWKEDDLLDRVLNISTYERIGGLKGALQKKVTDYYDALSPDHKRSLRRILLRLVEIGEKEIPVSRAAQKSELDTDLDRDVLEQLLNHEKLLIAKEGISGARGDSTVELAHEALISGWKEYHVWVAESREAISLRNALNNDAQQWERLRKSEKPTERKRASAEFWDGSRLERALELQNTDGFEQIGGLGALESVFLRESGKEREREIVRLRRRNLILSALSVLAIAGAIYGLYSSHQAELQRDSALRNEGRSWRLYAQIAEERRNLYPDTLLYAARAIGFEFFGRQADASDRYPQLIRRGRDSEAFWEAQQWITSRPAYLPVWSSARYPSPTVGMDVSADGRYIAVATFDGAVRLWDLRNETEREIQKPYGRDGTLAFYPNRNALAVIAGKEAQKGDLSRSLGLDFIRDTTGYKGLEIEVHSFSLEGDLVSRLSENTQVVAFSPGGDIMATAGLDGSIRLHQDNKVSVINTGMKDNAKMIVFGADNSRAVALFSDGIRVFFPRYSALAYAWATQQIKATAVALSPDGSRLLAGTADGKILIYDTSNAMLMGSCSDDDRHNGAVEDLAFRPDGQQLASASEDGTIRLWDALGVVPRVIATLRGHSSGQTGLIDLDNKSLRDVLSISKSMRGGVASIRYFPDGNLLASAGYDGSVRIWNISPNNKSLKNLYYYIDESWYSFNGLTNELEWAGGEGVVNVPSESLLGLHRTKSDVTPSLLAAQAWNGLPPDTPAPPALVSAAEAAAKAGRWREVELRLGQIDRLKGRTGTLDNLWQQMEDLVATGKQFRNPEGIELLWVKPGNFQMGSPEDEPGRFSNETQHKVTITQGYWLAKTELTQAQWKSVMGNNPSTYASSGLNAPVENISWEEAMDYCRRLTDRERARGSIPLGWEYTLPTEAQWEYACRAGGTTAYSFGNDPAELYKYGNYNDISGNFANADTAHDDGKQRTAPVASYPENPWGFHDMHGNVLEWCRDALDPNAPDYSAENATDPVGTVGAHRVSRGGGFYSATPIRDCRSAYRFAAQPTIRLSSLGFRPALVSSRKMNLEE